MKKITAMILALMMCMSLIVPVSAAGGTYFTIGGATANVGDTINLPVTFTSNVGVRAVGISFDYDTDVLELVGFINQANFNTTPFAKTYDVDKKLISIGWFEAQDFSAGIKLCDVQFNVIGKGNIKVKGSPVVKDASGTNDITTTAPEASVNATMKQITGISFAGAEYDYDGTAKSLSVKGTVPEGATVTYTSDDFNENGKAINVGTYNITATVKKAGYDDWTDTKVLKINPKNLTITELSAQNKTYDGTDKATLSGGVLNGKISGDDVTATIPTEGKFSDKNVGNNKTVTVNTIALSGAKKGNYTLTQPTGLKANIEKANLVVKANDKQMIKGAAIPTLDYSIVSGKLFGDDKISGKLSVNADGKTIGKFDITKGTLSAGDNYNLTVNNGKLTVSDKTTQNIVVSDITEKTYGDSNFKVDVIPDTVSNLTAFTFESSNTDVASIDVSGNVTIKNAGETNITVKQAGNDTYAPFERTQKLVVKKVEIVVTADAITKKVDTADPELTYTYTGTLVGTDNFTGKLERVAGEEIGKYDILQGTLALSDNYNLTYNKAIFEILDKTPQTITVADFGEKTYGDTAFAISVTPDATSTLSNFTYASDNEKVATVSATGEITIIGAGEANITVTEPGNTDYAQATATKKLTVAKRALTVNSIDLDSKTAVLDGVLEADKDVATLDFDKITLTIENAVDETTSNAIITNFALKGDKAENYNITTESLNATIANENVITVTITAENGTATGAAKYLKGAEVTVVATPDSGYKFSGWYNGDTVVSTSETYTFKAENDVSLVAKFTRRSTGGGGGGSSAPSSYTVKFETNGGSKIESVKVDKNGTIAEPKAPTKDGFEFGGWYTDKALKTKYDFSEKITKGFTLYAAWTEKKAETQEPTEPTKPESKITFTDVKDNDWFCENVKYVIENGLMNGITDTEFAPNDNLTRAMLVAILYRAAGEPAVNKSVPFADVVADSYYANAVIWAQQNGIVSGVNENEFAPDENITREQIATIIYRYAKAMGYDVSMGENTNILSYTDCEEISEYAIEAMQYAVGTGLMKGKSETTLNPTDTATRAEIAAILQRFIEGNK